MRFALVLALGLAGPASGQTILTVGDSVMAWNGAANIPAAIARELGAVVEDASVPGARVSVPLRALVGDLDIRTQLRALDGHDWVVATGGANDLGVECGCGACADDLDRLLSVDATSGEIAQIADTVRAGGARLLWITYYDVLPQSDFGPCVDEFDVLDPRIRRLAEIRADVYAVDAASVVFPQNPEHFDDDLVHPSPLGSALIGALAAGEIRRAGNR